jgi:hypothetical protein
MTEDTNQEVEVKDSETVEVNNDAILDAIKELTKQIAENTKVLNAMKATHDKWVRAGKF